MSQMISEVSNKSSNTTETVEYFEQSWQWGSWGRSIGGWVSRITAWCLCAWAAFSAFSLVLSRCGSAARLCSRWIGSQVNNLVLGYCLWWCLAIDTEVFAYSPTSVHILMLNLSLLSIDRHYLIVSAVSNLLVNLLGVWFFRTYARVTFGECQWRSLLLSKLQIWSERQLVQNLRWPLQDSFSFGTIIFGQNAICS